MTRPSPTDFLRRIHRGVVARIDGEVLVRQAGAAAPWPAPTHVLAVGKAALPMARGVLRPQAAGGAAAPLALIVPPGHLMGGSPVIAGAQVLPADHPRPTERSVAAALAARQFLSAVPPEGELTVLLSGGTSALLCGPAPGITLEDKRRCMDLLARAGVAIQQLNVVRKHLSTVKGGRLGVLARAHTTVLALSDVLGDDPSVIGSGPFTADPSTFGDALSIVTAAAPDAPAAVLAHLQAGAAGQLDETPKSGDSRLAQIEPRIIANPALVREHATQLAADVGWHTLVADPDTALPVPDLAARIVQRALATRPPWPLMIAGNGEPTLVVTGDGRGGRATHLALLVARGLAALPAERRSAVAFLAAGTDDRDGSANATGAVVDGNTWQHALQTGLDPAEAVGRCDSYPLLERIRATVRGPGTSNLLDMHLLAISG